MSDSSNRSFTDLTSPVDPTTALVLRAVDAVANSLGYDYFLVGATARHILLVNALGLPAARATRDIDFGVAVESWEQFDTFKQRLIGLKSFRATEARAHKLYYKDNSSEWETSIDLIPFGPLASGNRTIEWPPERDSVMNVAGFDEALRAAVLIRIDRGLTVKVASLPGLTILKFLAWIDRRKVTNKDATDVYTLLATYADAGNTERLYADEPDLLQNAGFDLELAGAQLLGRDVARICEKECLRSIDNVLRSERLLEELIAQIQQVTDPFGDYPKRVPELMDFFGRGIQGPA
jgi:predicted nucleotidyltransferase